jgi:methanogenic corrinoid protein MtbC1
MDAFHRNSGSASEGVLNAYADCAAAPSVATLGGDAWVGANVPKATLAQVGSWCAQAVDEAVVQPARSPRWVSAGRHRQRLVNTVTERLLCAHRLGGAPSADAAAGKSVVRLAERALSSDVIGAACVIKDLLRNGHALDDLYLDVIAAAARHLGQLWHDDAISFVDVTIGMLALCRLLHEFDDAFCGNRSRHDADRRMLLVARPGDSHEFAALLVSAFLRRAGWDVTCVTLETQVELTDLLANNRYALLGLSESCSISVDGIGSYIRAARKASQNEHLRVLVGGPAFTVDPDLAIRVGADASAYDARHAVTQAENLLAMARRDR